MSRRLSMQIRILSPYKPSKLNRPAVADPTTKKIGLPDSRVVYTVLRSPHIDKKSREQFEMKIRKELLVVNAETPEELRKKFFWLKRHRMYGAQYEVKISCQTHLPYQPSLTRQFSFASGSFAAEKKRVEDVMPIATGHEREELEAELQGLNLLDINFPVGPFGTKDAPAFVKSYFDRRLVGCPGGEGEDEHDVVWFWLQKGRPHECPVCSQYFKLEVVGPGGPPDGHGDDHH